MAVKTCKLSEYKSIPGNARILSVSMGKVVSQVTSTLGVLRFICETFVRTGILNPYKVRSFGFSWLGTNPHVMRQPRMLAKGVHLSEDGQGVTNLVRTSLLLQRLVLPVDHCLVSYEEVAIPSGHFMLDGKLEALSFISQWDESDEEPTEAVVQRRIHELMSGEASRLLPYKVGIGGKRYAVNSWSDLVNTFVAYIYLYIGSSGPRMLLDLQCSTSWSHCAIVKSTDGQIAVQPVPEGLEGDKACRLVNDLIVGIGFDRYSVYVKCTPAGDEQRVADHVPKSERAHESVGSVRELGLQLIPQEETLSSQDGMLCSPEESKEGEERMAIADVSIRRHLRPVFRLLD